MAITDKEQGVWGLDEVYNKQNEGDIWVYNATDPMSLYSFGYNNQGTLGLNNTTGVPGYTQLPGVWLAVGYGGEASSSAIKNTGALFSWGNGSYGTLAQNDETNYSSPKQVGTDTNWKQSAAVRESMGATKTNGELWMWGKNPHGQLAVNTSGNNAQRSSPVQVPGTTWDRLYGSMGLHYMAKKTDGSLWIWGRQYNGSLGQNQPNPSHLSSPTQVGTDTDWGTAAPGSHSSFALKTDGTLWGWGQNNYGQLGLNKDGTPNSRSSPTQIGTETTWSDLVAGQYMAAGIKTDGTLWTWGQANGNILGLNQPESDHRSSPTQVGTDTTWRTIYVAHSSAFATKTNGTLWSWGYNNRNSTGILGLSTFAKLSSPTQVPGANWYTTVGGSMFSTFGSTSP